MRELPTGTVTMLFSDIEGSTALLGRLGERYGVLATTLEMAAAATAGLGQALRAARIAGAAEGIRRKSGIPIKQPELLDRSWLPPV
jgi:hypothetical protein